MRPNLGDEGWDCYGLVKRTKDRVWVPWISSYHCQSSSYRISSVAATSWSAIIRSHDHVHRSAKQQDFDANSKLMNAMTGNARKTQTAKRLNWILWVASEPQFGTRLHPSLFIGALKVGAPITVNLSNSAYSLEANFSRKNIFSILAMENNSF